MSVPSGFDPLTSEWFDTRFGRGAREVLAVLEGSGASFFAELARASGRLASEVEDGLWELVAAGLVTADGFENLRALLDPKRRRGQGKGRRARPRHAPGRWALLRHTAAPPEGHAEAFARQLLLRWGVPASSPGEFRPDLPIRW